MEFYTFVDITPKLFNDKQKKIHGIDYVYTDNTGKVIKKTISESGNEKIPDGISIVHLVLERDEKVYNSNEYGYADILSATCSTIEYRNQLIKILGGEPIEMKPIGDFSDHEDEEDNESVDNKDPKFLFSEVGTPKGIPERHVVESHFNHFNHLANEGSRPPSGSSQQTLIEPGRRALIYNSLNNTYRIGIVGPYKKPEDNRGDGVSKPGTYFIDVPNPNGDLSYIINREYFEDEHHIPRNFKEIPYDRITRSTTKQPKDIFLLRKDKLTQLKPAQRGGKKTKKVHPAKKNITRSKRR